MTGELYEQYLARVELPAPALASTASNVLFVNHDLEDEE